VSFRFAETRFAETRFAESGLNRFYGGRGSRWQTNTRSPRLYSIV